MTAPAPLLAPTLDPASDTGNLGDNLTADNTPTINGTGPAGLGVQLWDGVTNSQIASGIIAPDGTWSITTSPLSNGVHQFYVYAVNAQGERSLAPSGILQVIVSTYPPPAPPAPTLDPNSGGSNTPRVNGVNAWRNATMHVILDGIAIGTTPTNGNGAWSYQLPTLAPGSHTVAGQVTDVFGLTGAVGRPLIINIASPIITVPGVPVAGTGTPHTVQLTWTTPSDGGSPITGYIITWSVQAKNAVGDSGSSAVIVSPVGP